MGGPADPAGRRGDCDYFISAMCETEARGRAANVRLF